MDTSVDRNKPLALSLLSASRPRNLGWTKAGGLLFGDWGTSRLYVLGIAFAFAGGTSLFLIAAMSILVLAVGWAYGEICRIYPDGGGVYSAAKHTSKVLAVFGALLLFADYVVTASLSSLDTFHYFGLPGKTQVVQVDPHAGGKLDLSGGLAGRVTFDAATGQLRSVGGKIESEDADALRKAANPAIRPAVDELISRSLGERLWAVDSPGFWAVIAIIAIGAFNLMGPKHTGGFAIGAAVGMIGLTLLISACAIPKINWGQAWHSAISSGLSFTPMWLTFVQIILALSGVEAIGNLTGVMKKPVATTARKAIWVVALEVAIFNIILGFAMVAALPDGAREAHKEDMMAFLAGHYVGPAAEVAVRVIGGLLLLSAVNTVVTDMISVQYLLSRDDEVPAIFQRLNRFGVPYLPAMLALLVPSVVLFVSHDLDALADLYAMGVVGAVTINISLIAFHPRLRGAWRKALAGTIGLLLLAIWITLGFTKVHALIFVGIVVAVGFTARFITKKLSTRTAKPSLLRQAILDQLTPETMAAPKILVGTYGSDRLANVSLRLARKKNAALVVCFIREVHLSVKYDQPLTIDTDPVAVRTFARFLDEAHTLGVKVVPVYDTGSDAAGLMAETAALYGCEAVIIGTSRNGAIVHLLKGRFQQRLESMLPPEIEVRVIHPESSPSQDVPDTLPAHA